MNMRVYLWWGWSKINQENLEFNNVSCGQVQCKKKQKEGIGQRYRILEQRKHLLNYHYLWYYQVSLADKLLGIGKKTEGNSFCFSRHTCSVGPVSSMICIK